MCRSLVSGAEQPRLAVWNKARNKNVGDEGRLHRDTRGRFAVAAAPLPSQQALCRANDRARDSTHHGGHESECVAGGPKGPERGQIVPRKGAIVLQAVLHAAHARWSGQGKPLSRRESEETSELRAVARGVQSHP